MTNIVENKVRQLLCKYISVYAIKDKEEEMLACIATEAYSAGLADGVFIGELAYKVKK